MKTSIQPTYDSRETGPRYWVTTRVGRRTIRFQRPLDDPFARTTVHIGLLDLLRGVFRNGLEVEVVIGADKELMDDVLELDANQLVRDRTRQRDFQREIHQSLAAPAVDQELREMTAEGRQ